MSKVNNSSTRGYHCASQIISIHKFPQMIKKPVLTAFVVVTLFSLSLTTPPAWALDLKRGESASGHPYMWAETTTVRSNKFSAKRICYGWRKFAIRKIGLYRWFTGRMKRFRRKWTTGAIRECAVEKKGFFKWRSRLIVKAYYQK